MVCQNALESASQSHEPARHSDDHCLRVPVVLAKAFGLDERGLVLLQRVVVEVGAVVSVVYDVE